MAVVHLQSMSELDTCHYKQQADMQTELKKEMSLLQKRLLMETVRICFSKHPWFHIQQHHYSKTRRYPM